MNSLISVYQRRVTCYPMVTSSCNTDMYIQAKNDKMHVTKVVITLSTVTNYFVSDKVQLSDLFLPDRGQL